LIIYYLYFIPTLFYNICFIIMLCIPLNFLYILLFTSCSFAPLFLFSFHLCRILHLYFNLFSFYFTFILQLFIFYLVSILMFILHLLLCLLYFYLLFFHFGLL